MNQPTQTTLLPCPFCGSAPCAEEPIRYLDGDFPPAHIVACHNTKCPTMPVASGDTPGEAAANWNTRSGGAE